MQNVKLDPKWSPNEMPSKCTCIGTYWNTSFWKRAPSPSASSCTNILNIEHKLERMYVPLLYLDILVLYVYYGTVCTVKSGILSIRPLKILSISNLKNLRKNLLVVCKDWFEMNISLKITVLRPFLAIFCHIYVHLSQNWSSDGHVEVLTWFKFWLVQKSRHKT